LDFERILKEVAGFFESEGIRYAVIGAFALHAYGRSRATSDLDFVTEFHAQPKLIAFLEGFGHETLHASSGYSNHLHRDVAMGRLDFVYISGETSRQLFGSARKLLVLGEMSIPVPRAEHIAAMKIQAMKNDPERTFQEMVRPAAGPKREREEPRELAGLFSLPFCFLRDAYCPETLFFRKHAGKCRQIPIPTHEILRLLKKQNY
jgi:hypothetical protein